jgi:hypothetical protein
MMSNMGVHLLLAVIVLAAAADAREVPAGGRKGDVSIPHEGQSSDFNIIHPPLVHVLKRTNDVSIQHETPSGQNPDSNFRPPPAKTGVV